MQSFALRRGLAMSQSCEMTVRLPADLHARPAGQMVQAVAPFDASITVAFGSREADARSVLAVMGLGATADGAVTLRATGPDAEQAVAAVVSLLGGLGQAKTELQSAVQSTVQTQPSR